jgi:hypothetical protein
MILYACNVLRKIKSEVKNCLLLCILVECMSIIPPFFPEGEYFVKCCADIWARIRLLSERRKRMHNGENFERCKNCNFNFLHIFKPEPFTSMGFV